MQSIVLSAEDTIIVNKKNENCYYMKCSSWGDTLNAISGGNKVMINKNKAEERWFVQVLL